MEPRQQEIARMRDHIKQMDEELAKYHQVSRTVKIILEFGVKKRAVCNMKIVRAKM